MNTCLRCQSPFGMIRRTLGMLWWQKSFCSKTCADSYVKEYQERERVSQFLSWLSRPG
jgi:hypothetical protein